MSIYLDISAASNLGKVLLSLQCLINLIIRHAENAESCLPVLVSLTKHDESRHEWYGACFFIEGARHSRHICRLLIIH